MGNENVTTKNVSSRNIDYDDEAFQNIKVDDEIPPLPPNKMFIISGDNSSTDIAQNVIESDWRVMYRKVSLYNVRAPVCA